MSSNSQASTLCPSLVPVLAGILKPLLPKTIDLEELKALVMEKHGEDTKLDDLKDALQWGIDNKMFVLCTNSVLNLENYRYIFKSEMKLLKARDSTANSGNRATTKPVTKSLYSLAAGNRATTGSGNRATSNGSGPWQIAEKILKEVKGSSEEKEAKRRRRDE